ncbi:MAG: glycogen debranching protein GlgX [Verrucomicrobia bacterium]|nr:glycogen debranching protein GlgX [Verrucomicrobiota bacterium]
MTSPTPASDCDSAGLRPGVFVDRDRATFVLRCSPAARVWLLLFDVADDDRPSREIALERSGDLWSARVPGAGHGTPYVYRVEAPGADSAQWLLDPCAAAVATPRRWGETTGLTPGRWPRHGAAFPKGLVVDDARYDWGGDRPPNTPLRETVIYEAHVRGFTAHPSSCTAAPGTYSAFVEKIPHLHSLGVTAVEFMPVQEFDEMEFFIENGRRRALRNLWGYSPVAWSAPNARFAAGHTPGAAVDEFRDLVRALHAAGIEVLLDVVFNHTAETDRHGPVLSFKGLDRSLYYILKAGSGETADFTGCGNTVNANQPEVTELIVDSLRRWVREFHVDGFRFDLASALTRGPDGRPMAHPPLLARITHDPVLQHVKLIAEPWDAANLYQVGAFPGMNWQEWNGRFRDDVRRFWRGDPGMLGLLATRLAGSSDLYRRHPRGPLSSVNFVACHDGFTLADLVRYAHPHNEANGEGGADGEKHNHSFNGGIEGPSDDPATEARRLRQQRNLLATVFLAQGVPMLLAGDELGRTQRGNNNAYAQDNEISWVDWSLADRNAGLLDFTRRLIRLRAGHPALRRETFLTGHGEHGAPADVQWIGPDGAVPDWHAGKALGMRLSGCARCTGAEADGPDLLVLINGGTEGARFGLPAGAWTLEIATADPAPTVHDALLALPPHSLAVLLGPCTGSQGA